MIEKYIHYGRAVYVKSELKGKHKEMCLCHCCNNFKPLDRERNCLIANTLYELDVLYNLVTPVFECPSWVDKEKK